jgi:pyruvate formate lyase activating enzyme
LRRRREPRAADPVKHKNWTVADNTRTLEDLRRAYETFPKTKFVARRPLMPWVNDDEEHIRAVLAFIKLYKNVIDYELLINHRFDENRYNYLGRCLFTD